MSINLRLVIADTVRAVPEVVPYLSPDALRLLAPVKAAGDYDSIRDRLYDAIYSAIVTFLESNQQAGTGARAMSDALSQAYVEAADVAYQDGGADLPLDPDTAAWARAQLESQFGFVDALFETLKALRKEGDFDAAAEGTRRAENYASALDGYYNSIVLRAAPNKMLTWVLGNTEKHCKDCSKLNGQRHRASWYSARGYFPRMPGSATECGGWRCDCSLQDDDGNEVTI